MSEFLEGGKGCFAGSTMVATPSGPVRIDNIRPGDEVVCFDESGALHTGKVSEVVEHPLDTIYRLFFWRGHIDLTHNHWLLNQFGNFAEAGTLTIDDAVVDKNGHLRPVIRMEKIGQERVYNLRIEPHHTFIAGDIRVHNGGRGVGIFQEHIEGQKGGGGKGSGGSSSSVYTPTEAPNTLRSKATAKVIDLIGEGECYGLANQSNPATCIKFDGVQLQNDDLSYNFSGVTWYQRYGTPDQDPIPGFDYVAAEVTDGQEVKYTAPVLFTINSTDVDAVRIKVQTPSLFEQKTNGDLVGATINYRIEVSAGGGPFVTHSSPSIDGKTVSSYEEAVRVQLRGFGDAPYVVKVSRLSAESESAAKQDKLYVSGYTEITEVRMIYPNSALIGLVVDAQLFGGAIPKRSYRWKGLIIRVPSNYNPATREYTGVWDGTFQLAWTDNPAWILYDVLVEPRYGLGEWIDASQVDKWQLYQIAQYCDELVDDGFGGTEPRFRLNTVINTREEAYAVVNAIVSVFRGMCFWASGSVTATHDAPADFKRLVTPADVVGGDFTYKGSAAKARHTVALVTWNDPADNYRQAIEVVENPAAIAKRGWNPVDVAAFGCISRGQAHRLGKWILDSEENESETVTYTAGYDHADTEPGTIVAIADPSRQGVRAGGRIMSVGNATITLEDGSGDILMEDGQSLIPEGPSDFLELDAPITVVDGDQILVLNTEDVIETINLIPGSTGMSVGLASSPSGTIAPGAMYIVQNAARLVPELWKVLGVVEVDKHLFEVTALAHDPNKFARVEQDVVLEERPTSLLPTGALLPPTNFDYRESLYKVNNALLTRVTLSWTPPVDPRVTMYRVDAKSPSSNSFNTVYIGPLTTAEIPNAETGIWSFNVYSVASSSEAGSLGSRAQLVDQPVYGKALPPGDVQNLVAIRSYTGATLQWDKVDDLDLTGYDVRRGTDWDAGEIVVENFIGTSIYVELKTSQPVSFMVRARDELGVLSTTIATVQTSVSALPDLIDFRAYQIGSSIRLVWTGVDGLEKIKYEVRQGDSFDTGRQVAITNTPEFLGPFSVSTQTLLTFHVRAFINFDDETRSLSTAASTTILKYPTLGNNIIFNSPQHSLFWPGTLSADVEVTVDNLLTLVEGSTEGYYDFEIDIGAEYFGRCWYEAVSQFLDADSLEVDEALMDVNDATFYITPFSALSPQVELWLLNDDDTLDKRFEEADYTFQTQKFRVILKRDTGDILKPAVEELTVFFDVPDFML